MVNRDILNDTVKIPISWPSKIKLRGISPKRRRHNVEIANATIKLAATCETR